MSKILLASVLDGKRKHLIEGLNASGFDVSTACTSAHVWHALMRHQIDLLVIDASVSSPQLDPWMLIGELAELDHPRLIVFTRADRAKDRLRAFRSGVCHCLTMPVSAAELAALLEALAKEEQKSPDGHANVPDYADRVLQIDFANRQIRRRGKVFPLTGREHSVLRRLIEKSGRVSSSEELCHSTWGQGSWPAKRMQLKIHILQLRRKIEHDHTRPRYLISHRGLGYAFMPQAGE